MASVEITIDGVTQEIDIDLDNLTLQEAVIVEETLGTEKYMLFTNGIVTPSAMRAILFAKLKRAGLGDDIEAFDFDITEEVTEAFESVAEEGN